MFVEFNIVLGRALTFAGIVGASLLLPAKVTCATPATKRPNPFRMEVRLHPQHSGIWACSIEGVPGSRQKCARCLAAGSDLRGHCRDNSRAQIDPTRTLARRPGRAKQQGLPHFYSPIGSSPARSIRADAEKMCPNLIDRLRRSSRTCCWRHIGKRLRRPLHG